MRFCYFSFPLIILFAIVMLLPACSKDKSPVGLSTIGLTTEEPASVSIEISESTSISFDNDRNILGIYRAEINIEKESITVEPLDRIGSYHFNLTSLYPNVLTITGFGFTPNFWADIKLSHPFPGSGIDAFDARVIAVLPANPGVSMDYPVMDVHANNSVLLEPDGYTKLWDNPGIPGNANPFVAYFKDQPNRIWSSTGVTQETKTWLMDISGFGGPLVFNLIVDVSTNFPNPPQSVIDNAPEPVQIEVVVGDGMTPGGGSACVEVTLLD